MGFRNNLKSKHKPPVAGHAHKGSTWEVETECLAMNLRSAWYTVPGWLAPHRQTLFQKEKEGKKEGREGGREEGRKKADKKSRRKVSPPLWFVCLLFDTGSLPLCPPPVCVCALACACVCAHAHVYIHLPQCIWQRTTWDHVVQDGLRFTMYLRMTFNFWFSCLYLPVLWH